MQGYHGTAQKSNLPSYSVLVYKYTVIRDHKHTILRQNASLFGYARDIKRDRGKEEGESTYEGRAESGGGREEREKKPQERRGQIAEKRNERGWEGREKRRQ